MTWQQSWVKLVRRGSRQEGLDDLRLEQEKAESRRTNGSWASNEQRYRKVKNKMAQQKTYGKFRQRELIQLPLSDNVVSCNRIRIAMRRESSPQLRLPKWEDAVRLQ